MTLQGNVHKSPCDQKKSQCVRAAGCCTSLHELSPGWLPLSHIQLSVVSPIGSHPSTCLSCRVCGGWAAWLAAPALCVCVCLRALDHCLQNFLRSHNVRNLIMCMWYSLSLPRPYRRAYIARIVHVHTYIIVDVLSCIVSYM